jgi:hypothetical protein
VAAANKRLPLHLLHLPATQRMHTHPCLLVINALQEGDQGTQKERGKGKEKTHNQADSAA